MTIYTQQSTPSCGMGSFVIDPSEWGGATHMENGYCCQDSTRKKSLPSFAWHTIWTEKCTLTGTKSQKGVLSLTQGFKKHKVCQILKGLALHKQRMWCKFHIYLPMSKFKHYWDRCMPTSIKIEISQWKEGVSDNYFPALDNLHHISYNSIACAILAPHS